MEFQQVVRRRRMIRSFESRPVPAEVIDRILSNAAHAPSAGYSQGWAFLVLDASQQREAFWNATFPVDERREFRWPAAFNAPVIIVTLSHMDAYLDRYAEPDKGWTDRDPGRWPVPYWHIDTGFAALLMLLTVVDQGLGAVFFGVRNHDSFRAAFGVPDAYTPIGAIAIGYPAPDEPSPSLRRGRRPLDEIVHWGRWNGGR